MADCVCLERCPFFNDRMANMPAVADMMKEKYCKGDSSSCARFMVFKAKGKDFVPADMYPRDVAKAKELMAS